MKLCMSIFWSVQSIMFWVIILVQFSRVYIFPSAKHNVDPIELTYFLQEKVMLTQESLPLGEFTSFKNKESSNLLELYLRTIQLTDHRLVSVAAWLGRRVGDRRLGPRLNGPLQPLPN